MVTAPLKRLRGNACLLRLVLVLALSCLVSAGGWREAAAAATGSDTALLQAVSVLCESAHHKTGQNAPSPHGHVVEQAVLHSAGGTFVALPDGAIYLPAPIWACIGEAAAPPGARAPPVRLVSAAFPRGPPHLV